jgi:hypothetical protein
MHHNHYQTNVRQGAPLARAHKLNKDRSLSRLVTDTALFGRYVLSVA